MHVPVEDANRLLQMFSRSVQLNDVESRRQWAE